MRATLEFRRYLAWGLVLSAGLHLAFYPLIGRLSLPGLPHQMLPEWSFATLESPPLVQVPAPPEPIVQPDLPRPTPVSFEDELGIEATTVAPDGEVTVGPPPVVGLGQTGFELVSYDVPPILGNRTQFGTMAHDFYPLELQRAGVEGAVDLVIHIGRAGRVEEVRVEGSSGFPSMDDAALRLAERLEFLPALMRDQLVAVWVHQRICFRMPKRDASTTPAAAAMRRLSLDGC